MSIFRNEHTGGGGSPKSQNYLPEGRPLEVQASLLGECSRNQLVTVYQLALL